MIKENCMLRVYKQRKPEAIHLRGYIWGISSRENFNLYVTCPRGDRHITINAPMTLFALDNGCTASAPDILIPATSHIGGSIEYYEAWEWCKDYNIKFGHFTHFAVWEWSGPDPRVSSVLGKLHDDDYTPMDDHIPASEFQEHIEDFMIPDTPWYLRLPTWAVVLIVIALHVLILGAVALFGYLKYGWFTPNSKLKFLACARKKAKSKGSEDVEGIELAEEPDKTDDKKSPEPSTPTPAPSEKAAISEPLAMVPYHTPTSPTAPVEPPITEESADLLQIMAQRLDPQTFRSLAKHYARKSANKAAARAATEATEKVFGLISP